ncbi:hypothetical protein CUD01_17360 [Cellulomonas uda]|uniref:Uncharacterized protein n=2 Tax=Cellulomonadaceae TaxID=85016 RepID=A0A4Y3KBH7_CELUD|nr:hypothetical protein CUD01_17360 [Cellulomonas uda]
MPGGDKSRDGGICEVVWLSCTVVETGRTRPARAVADRRTFTHPPEEFLMHALMTTDLARADYVERERAVQDELSRAERARSREHAASHPPERRPDLALLMLYARA